MAEKKKKQLDLEELSGVAELRRLRQQAMMRPKEGGPTMRATKPGENKAVGGVKPQYPRIEKTHTPRTGVSGALAGVGQALLSPVTAPVQMLVDAKNKGLSRAATDTLQGFLTMPSNVVKAADPTSKMASEDRAATLTGAAMVVAPGVKAARNMKLPSVDLAPGTGSAYARGGTLGRRVGLRNELKSLQRQAVETEMSATQSKMAAATAATKARADAKVAVYDAEKAAHEQAGQKLLARKEKQEKAAQPAVRQAWLTQAPEPGDPKFNLERAARDTYRKLQEDWKWRNAPPEARRLAERLDSGAVHDPAWHSPDATFRSYFNRSPRAEIFRQENASPPFRPVKNAVTGERQLKIQELAKQKKAKNAADAKWKADEAATRERLLKEWGGPEPRKVKEYNQFAEERGGSWQDFVKYKEAQSRDTGALRGAFPKGWEDEVGKPPPPLQLEMGDVSDNPVRSKALQGDFWQSPEVKAWADQKMRADPEWGNRTLLKDARKEYEAHIRQNTPNKDRPGRPGTQAMDDWLRKHDSPGGGTPSGGEGGEMMSAGPQFQASRPQGVQSNVIQQQAPKDHKGSVLGTLAGVGIGLGTGNWGPLASQFLGGAMGGAVGAAIGGGDEGIKSTGGGKGETLNKNSGSSGVDTGVKPVSATTPQAPAVGQMQVPPEVWAAIQRLGVFGQPAQLMAQAPPPQQSPSMFGMQFM